MKLLYIRCTPQQVVDVGPLPKSSNINESKSIGIVKHDEEEHQTMAIIGDSPLRESESHNQEECKLTVEEKPLGPNICTLEAPYNNQSQ